MTDAEAAFYAEKAAKRLFTDPSGRAEITYLQQGRMDTYRDGWQPLRMDWNYVVEQFKAALKEERACKDQPSEKSGS